MYSADSTTRQLIRAHKFTTDVVVSPNGKTRYSVTEHSKSFPHLFCYFAFLITFRFDTDSFTASFMDVYSITSTLTHTQSLTILPPKSNSTNYRGNTLCLRQLSPTSNHLFATTRGFDTTHKRYLTVFHVLPSGLLDADEETIERWQTPSGRK